jgi:hypothetical protein
MLVPLASRKEKYLEMQGKLRFIFLMLVCFAEFGRYYCVDVISPLQDNIIDVLYSYIT